MVGGLTQLVCKGQIDSYINVNPDISFYKFAYKKHTNFAFESIRLDFEITPLLDRKDTIYKCKISRYADLLSNLYFVYKLPAIYSSNKYRFRWIKNIGTLLIKKAYITVGSTILDNITGEYLLINNELSMDKKDNYDNISGNVKNIYDPTLPVPILRINNNYFTDISYPVGDKEKEIKSIYEREIIIPLSFNFTKHTSLALLLLKLQSSEIYLNIELEDVENLYQVYIDAYDLYVSPRFYNNINPNDYIDILKFVKTSFLNAYIEANYIFIDNDERAMMMIDPITSILIEQVFISNFYTVKAGNELATTIELNGANNHNKEIIWTLKRDDYRNFNNITNYTNDVIENNLKPIMTSAIINFNKTNRIEQKDANYFNLIQPYQHHSSIPKQGIYTYSFAIQPEKWIPTGSFNGSCITTSIVVYVNKDDNEYINEKMRKMGINEYSYNYELRYYVKSLNILEYNSGTLGIKYV
jgi:hypothetical protein